jgi:hypothetical protein
MQHRETILALLSIALTVFLLLCAAFFSAGRRLAYATYSGGTVVIFALTISYGVLVSVGSSKSYLLEMAS